MDPGFTKTLRFTYEDLGKEGYLIFTFNNEKVSGLIYKDYVPVIWRAIHLRKKTGKLTVSCLDLSLTIAAVRHIFPVKFNPNPDQFARKNFL
jgi:hypothetical protein